MSCWRKIPLLITYRKVMAGLEDAAGTQTIVVSGETEKQVENLLRQLWRALEQEQTTR